MPASLADMIPSRSKRPMAVRQIGFGGGAISTGGSTTPTVRSVSADGNLLTTDEYLLIDASTDKSFTLNTPSTAKRYNLKITTGNGNVTLTPASGTIDGAANYIFSGDQSSIGLLFDGTNWFVFI